MAKPPLSFFLLLLYCSGFMLLIFSDRYSSAPPVANIVLSHIPIIGKILPRRTLGDTTVITVPSSNPVTVYPTNPSAVPVTVPSSNSPVPVAAYPPPSPSSTGVPVTNSQPPPPSATNAAPAVSGQKWCVAKSGVSQSVLQSALDYACGMGGIDCSQIQQGGSCYNPDTLQNHASFAFNAYYQKNPAPTSCDFGGTATLVTTNPSTGSCVYPSSSSSSSSSPTTPTPSSPTTPSSSASSSPPTSASSSSSSSSSPTKSPTPTTPSSSGGSTLGYGRPTSSAPLTSSNPASGYMPLVGSQSPPSTSWSHSSGVRPFVALTVLLIWLVTANLNMRT